MSHVRLVADASPVIGTGHVTRSVALAEALEADGFTVSLSGSIDGPDWLHQIAGRFLNADGSLHLDEPAAIIIDSYEAQRIEEVSAGRTHGLLGMILDDATPMFDADLYIEPGVNLRTRALPARARSLTGPQHVLLRSSVRRNESPRGARVGMDPLHILIALGGGGGYGLLERIVSDLNLDGSSATISYIAPSPMNRVVEAQWLPPTRSMSTYFSKADIAIVTAGVTSWEALHHGLATTIIEAVDNQEGNYRFMTENGLALGLGRPGAGEALNLQPVHDLLSDEALRRRLQTAGWQAVDGRGAERVAKAIQELLTDDRHG